MQTHEEVIKALEHVQVVTYLHFAGATVLIYDYFLTLPLETSLVWPTPWSPTKLLFLLTRYLPFFGSAVVLYHQILPNATEHACELTYQISGWMFVTGIAIAEVILTIKTWAIWGKDRRLTIGLPIFYIMCFIPLFVITGIFLESMKFAPMPSPHLLGCLVTGGSPILSAVWILLMVYEAGIFFLMLFKCMHYKRSDSGLFRVVFRDGLLYYMYLFVLSLANVVIVLALPRDLVNLLPSVECAIHAILTCRVLLDLRDHTTRQTVTYGEPPDRMSRYYYE